MSLKSRKVGMLAAAGAAAAFVLPSSALAAQTATLTYKCKFPIIGVQPLTLDIALDIPNEWDASKPTDEFQITAKATAGGTTATGLGLVDGLRWLKGVNTPDPANGMTTFAHVLQPNGVKTNVKVPINVTPYEVINPVTPPVVLNATAVTPSLTFDDEGVHKINLDRLQLNLAGTDVNGNPVEGLITPSKAIDGVTPFTDTDRLPGQSPVDDPTFNVPCDLDPKTGQNLTLAQFTIVPPDGGGDDIVPPTKPGPGVGYTEADFTSSSINLRWAASTDNVGVDKYVIEYDGLDGLETVEVPGNATSKLITGLGADSDYVFSITAYDAAGNASETFTTDILVTLPVQADPKPPTKPGKPTGTSTETTIDLTWPASTDSDGTVTGYNVYQGSSTTPTKVTTNSLKVTNLTPGTNYSFTVEAIDDDNLKSAKSDAGEVSTKADTTKPTAPSALKATPSSSSVALTWTASTDNVGVKEYVVSGGGKSVTVAAPATAGSITGLSSNTEYTFTVVAKDAAGNTSDAGTIKSTTTGGPLPTKLGYTLAGTTTLKTLTKGNLNLTGSIAADFIVATGLFSADLTLNDTSGRLTSLGFLPVTAKIGFVPTGKTTGNLDQDTNVLSTKSLVRIKVKEVKLFGAIPLAGGNNCQTKSLSEINLKSAPGFQPLDGGTITGTYKISDLNGCGALNGLVSPLTAGGGNTINLKLTPKLP